MPNLKELSSFEIDQIDDSTTLFTLDTQLSNKVEDGLEQPINPITSLTPDSELHKKVDKVLNLLENMNKALTDHKTTTNSELTKLQQENKTLTYRLMESEGKAKKQQLVVLTSFQTPALIKNLQKQKYWI